MSRKTYCARRRNNCVHEDDITDTTYTSVDPTTTVSESMEEEEPEIPVLPVPPALLRNVFHAGQVFKSALMEKEMMLVKWQRRRFRGPVNQLTVAMMARAKTLEIIEAFMHCVGTCGWELTVAEARIFRSPPLPPKHPGGRLVLLEKLVPGLHKINSNTGWRSVTKSMPAQIIEGLCHFSYAWSRGALVMCNVWASFDHEEKSIVMTTPVFHSKEGGLYGCGDLGVKGMCSFFCGRKCNRFNSGYDMPPRKAYYKAQEETVYVV